MLIAVIGDIAGNFPAFSAVTRHIEDAGIQTKMQTGNIVVGQQWNNEIIEMLQSTGFQCVQGPMDRRVVRFNRKQASLKKKFSETELAAMAHAFETTHSTGLEFLRGLPKTVTLEIDQLSVILCHGTPTNPADILTADTPLMKLQRLRELSSPHVLICGGAPTAFSHMVDGCLVVCPGPVETAPGQAQYTLISTEEKEWEATSQVVAYEGVG
jgi:predicted phosphodiesterase